jgi:hypothetical protein
VNVNDVNPVNDSAVPSVLQVLLNHHQLPPIPRRFTSFTRFTTAVAVSTERGVVFRVEEGENWTGIV